jgi:transposase-like protein
MAKRWSDEEKAVLLAHYSTARSVEDVAKMIGRMAYVVRKKALAMGLSRPDQHKESIGKVTAVLSATPITSGEIAALIGMTRSATNDVLRRAEAEGLCHIAEYKPCSGRGKDAAMWAVGEAGTLRSTRQKEALAERVRRTAEDANRLPARDPISAAWFGTPAQHFASADLSRRIFKQSMSVRDDELEVAA